ncbi:hypothetical protein MtrunA17_Chr7g0222691 [Medicago truncatula]|uniref:Transmembrane protein n=1 Tax=Medicago truncatula TaxID=3880 RepID=A0A396H1G2_MEDTR|nr:hypothetical protein MtrunA17_Chr7g0222691 [Medicago truncatula]
MVKFTLNIRYASNTQFPFMSICINCHILNAYVIFLLLLHFIMDILWLFNFLQDNPYALIPWRQIYDV